MIAKEEEKFSLVLELTREEAVWLNNIAQNDLSGAETPEMGRIRKLFFNATANAVDRRFDREPFNLPR